MQSIVQSLLALQEIDRDLFRARRELERLPRDRARRQGALDERAKVIADLRKEAREYRTRIKEIEDAAAGMRERIRKIEKAAAEARGDASLHANYEHEKRSLTREIGRGDEEGLSWLERAETADAQANEKQGELDGMLREFEIYARNVEQETAQARARVEDLGAKRRERLSTALTPEALALYERILIAREGDAMALLENNICQGCFISVPSNLYVRLRKGTEILQCPSCDRILYTH